MSGVCLHRNDADTCSICARPQPDAGDFDERLRTDMIEAARFNPLAYTFTNRQIEAALRATPKQGDEAKLREALAPFAKRCDLIADDESDEERAEFRLLVKDYRRARAAFKSSGEDARSVEERGRIVAKLREALERWRSNLAITRDAPMAGDFLHGPALDFVIEQLDGILARTLESDGEDARSVEERGK